MEQLKTVILEIVIPIENKNIQKMKTGQLRKMVDNLEVLKPIKKHPGVRLRVTIHKSVLMGSIEETIQTVFDDICKKLHLKLVFLKGQVFDIA